MESGQYILSNNVLLKKKLVQHTPMLHIVLIDESYPINTRNRKIINSFANHYGDEVNLSVITWDRSNDYTEERKGYHVYKKSSEYGNKTRKLLNLWGYRQYCHATIKALNPDVVIASHWNNLVMVPKLNRRRQMFIYENLDVPTEAYILRKASTIVEHWHMRRVDLTIHASRFFPQLYSPKHKQLILENKPLAPSILPTPSSIPPSPYTVHSPIRMAFIGTLRYHDIMKILIDAVRNDSRFLFFFHGDGHALQYMKECAKGASNIFFTGRYAYEDVGRLYQQTDIVWAAYPNRDFNVVYAISNKFHESLSFGIPTVYADNTCLGDFVVKNHIGMVVDPYSTEAIKSLLNHIVANQDDLKKMADDMRAFNSSQTTWEEDFLAVTKAIDTFFQ